MWGKTYMTHLKPLVLLQKQIVRIVTGSSYLAQTEPLMKQNKILNINSINDYSRAIFLYNFTRSNLPTMFQNYFDYNRDYHPYNTRYRNDLHTASYNLDVRKFSIRAAGPVLWNALPREIRDSPTVHSFKRRLKLYLSENQRNPYWTFGDKPFLYQRTMSTRRMFSIQICNQQLVWKSDVSALFDCCFY